MGDKITIQCPKCKGDGLYRRHTSYTLDGKPHCFRCNGTGKILVRITKRDCKRQHKWQIVGPFMTPRYLESVDNFDEIPF